MAGGGAGIDRTRVARQGSDLAAQVRMPLQQRHPQARTGEAQAGGQPGDAAADDDDMGSVRDQGRCW